MMWATKIWEIMCRLLASLRLFSSMTLNSYEWEWKRTAVWICVVCGVSLIRYAHLMCRVPDVINILHYSHILIKRLRCCVIHNFIQYINSVYEHFNVRHETVATVFMFLFDNGRHSQSMQSNITCWKFGYSLSNGNIQRTKGFFKYISFITLNVHVNVYNNHADIAHSYTWHMQMNRSHSLNHRYNNYAFDKNEMSEINICHDTNTSNLNWYQFHLFIFQFFAMIL